MPGADCTGPSGTADRQAGYPGVIAEVPQGVPAQPHPLQDLSRDRGTLRHLCKDGGKVHRAGPGGPAARTGGEAMSGVLEGMDGISPVDVTERWHARLMSTACTLAEREKFEAWLRQSPEHALAFEDPKALWASLASLYGDEAIGSHVAAAVVPDLDPVQGQWSPPQAG